MYGAATIFNRLLEYKPENPASIEPGLAERWEISEDGRIVTFHLRRGVKFHTTPWFKPTRDFNAEDVIFTFERLHNPDMPFRKAHPTEFPHFQGLERIISKIEAPDLYTARFTLNSIHAPFLSVLAVDAASIVSAEYAQQLLKEGKPSEFNQKPVGTGPFIFRKYDKDSTIVFDGNLEYWKPEDVRLSRLIFAITPDAAVRAQKLIKNECQVSVVPRPSDIVTLRKVPHLQVLSRSGFSMGYLAYNMAHQPLDDVRVRRALDMAIDKKAIIDVVFGGRAQRAVSLMPPMQWSYDKTLRDTPRDLKQAKKLLAQAGYPNGFTLALWTMSAQRPYNPDPRLMAQMIQVDWKKIGVKAKIVTYELAEYLRRVHKGEHDAVLIGWVGERNDPDEWLETVRFSHWRNKVFDDLCRKARRTIDTAKRTQLYLEAQKVFKREQPFTPIAYPNKYQIINRRVTGFKINFFDPTIFSGVGLVE
ncbi:ABC transporter substrate-binding protein [Candidatus Glomeribacter gigasporarum]|uniref:ABC transporter substrate-binding protein n=1 Tax=Candidatus Glomeribacter gigasporarum TaxID=132144 RepID=UPI002A4E1A12|nr:ABC transporter substrate-binding protein [Candidatus Glomeribacter gigasporarum]